MTYSGMCFYPIMCIWPMNGDVRVVIFSTSDFALKSCMSSFTQGEIDQLGVDDGPNEEGE